MAKKGRSQKSSRDKTLNSKASKKASGARTSSNKKKTPKKSGSKKSQSEIASLFAKISKVAPFGATILNSSGAFAGSDGGY